MTENYSIRLEGTGTQDDLVIDDIATANININESAMSDFSAVVPKTPEARQYLQQTIYFEDDITSDIVWYGTLESWEESETGVETNLAGRGPLLEEKQDTAEYTFNSRFADDALEEYVNTESITDFSLVFFDRDERVKDTSPTNTGAGTTGTVENQVTLPTSETFTDWEIYVKYNEELTSSTVGVSDTSGGADESTTVTEDATEFGHTELTTTSATSAPYVYVDIPTSSAEIVHIVAIPSDSSQRYIISEEVNGDVLSGIQTLAEIAGYRFGPKDYNAIDTTGDTHIIFPIGYETAEPDWRILDANRASDYSGYANKVTVRGAADGSGGYYSVTVKDQDEIDLVGRTISRYDKRVDLSTDTECRAVAKTTLSEALQNRGESGSLTTTIPSAGADISVGAVTPVSVWNETFNDGGMVGTDALYYQKKDDATPYVITDDDVDYSGGQYQFSMTVYPDLTRTTHDVTIMSLTDEVEMLVLSPDGTITFNPPASGVSISSDAGVIDNQTTQTITVKYGGDEADATNPDTATLKVDGEVVAYQSNVSSTINTGQKLYIGNRNRVSDQISEWRVGSGTSIIGTFDSDSYDSTNGEFTNFADTPSGALNEDSTDWNYIQPAAYREGVEATANNSGTFSVPNSAETEISTGVLSVASWVKGDGAGYIVESGGTSTTDEGYNVLWTGGSVEANVSYGSTYQSTVTSSTLDFTSWHHVAVVFDNTSATIRIIVDGEVDTEVTGLDGLNGSDILSGQPVSILARDTTGTFQIDELRMWDREATLTEAGTLAELGPNYDDVLRGGLDDFHYYDGTLTTTYEEPSYIRSNAKLYYEFDDDTTPQTALDSAGTYTGTINEVDYGAVKAPPREMSYNFVDDVTAGVKFDIAGRVDTELADVRENLENVKR